MKTNEFLSSVMEGLHQWCESEKTKCAACGELPTVSKLSITRYVTPPRLILSEVRFSMGDWYTLREGSEPSARVVRHFCPACAISKGFIDPPIPKQEVPNAGKAVKRG